jgi:hypothetical protein
LADLEALTREEEALDRMIAQRKQEAKDRKIFEKAASIAKELADGKNPWSENGLTIRYDDWNSKVTVLYQQKIVFNAAQYDSWGSPSIDTYIPGPWEKELNQPYSAAQKKAQVREEAARVEALRKRTEEIARKRERWGLEGMSVPAPPRKVEPKSTATEPFKEASKRRRLPPAPPSLKHPKNAPNN